jgi:hypothetical protein
MNISIVIAFSSLMVAITTLYITNIRYQDVVYVSQDGAGKYVSRTLDRLQITTNDFSHLSFVNSGTRPVLVEDMFLVVFQPGSSVYDYQLSEFTQASNNATNKFDGESCRGDMTINRFNFPSFALHPGEARVQGADFGVNSGLPALEGRDGDKHHVVEIPLTKENSGSQVQTFVYCFSVHLLTADARRVVVNRPQWSASFKPPSGGKGELVDHSFDWLHGLDTKILDQWGTIFNK